MIALVWAAVVLAALGVVLSQWVEVRLGYRGGIRDGGLEVAVAGFGGRSIYRSAGLLRRPVAGFKAGTGAVMPMSKALAHPDLERIYELVDTVRRAVADYHAAVDYLATRAVGTKIKADLAIGTGEAASTGIAAGVGWAALGTLAVQLQRNLPKGSARPDFKVCPDYRRRVFEASLDCIFKVRAGYIIGAALRLLRTNRRRTVRARSGSNGRASNPRPDEDGHGKHQGHGRREHHRR
ncbi:MAG: DUF2953 domain-containing protein [Bacillota bacterium]